MQFGALREGRLLRRYKRFLADVDFGDGEAVTVHCPNPGSMRTCAPDGAPVWVSESDNPKRKLKHTWELVRADGAMVCVNTMRANPLVEEALVLDRIPELSGSDDIRREVKWGDNSRIDFVLDFAGQSCLVEVKNVTLDLGGGVSAFPDSVTARGTKHLRELIGAVGSGHRAVLFFCVTRDDAVVVRPADDIDPLYGQTLREAADAGVLLLAYKAEISPESMVVTTRLPIELPPL